MAINLATKYMAQVDEEFDSAALTTPGVNADYDMSGARTAFIYDIPTTPMRDYTRSGAARYGVPEELGDTVQEFTLERDRCFSFVIDKGNDADQMYAKNAGKALKRQMHYEVIPEIDTYRLTKMFEGAGTTDATQATSANAYELFLNAQGVLGNARVPISGRVAFVTYNFYALLKLNPSFIGMGDAAQETRYSGQLGIVDGVPVIPVPDSYMPENAQFILAHRNATVAPVKLAEYKIHKDPPGINGALVEGRVFYDAIVLDSKKMGVYASKAI